MTRAGKIDERRVSEGESHPSLANASVQKMIKMITVDSMFLPGSACWLECW